MLKQVTSESYLNAIVSDKEIYNNPLFLNTVSKANDSDLVYFVFYKKEIVTVALALFVKQNQVILPSQYLFYSGIWIKDNLETRNSRDSLVACLLLLKKKYDKIDLCLPLSILDIRPFTWTGFNTKIRYTYEKKVAIVAFEKDVKTNYKKSLELGLTFINNQESKIDWLIYKDQLLRFGVRLSNVNKMKVWISELHTLNMIFQFSVVAEGKVIANAVLLNDYENKKAYFLLRKIEESEHKKYINSFFYVEILKFLSNESYLDLDYLGANMRSIAEFKARYKPQLKVNYMVSYRKRSIDFKRIKTATRNVMINFLNYFNR